MAHSPCESSPAEEAWVLASYQPRRVPFQQPKPTTNFLKSSDPTIKSYAATPVRITPVEHSSIDVIGEIKTISWGTYNEGPACLVVFAFSLSSSNPTLRYRNSNIKVTFYKYDTASLAEASPTVLIFAPKRISGLRTEEGKKSAYNIYSSASTPDKVMATKTLWQSICTGSGKSESRSDYTYVESGDSFSTRPDSGRDGVCWEVLGNTNLGYGVPDDLAVAVVVGTDGPFQAVVEIFVDTTVGNGLSASPWSAQKPVLFVPGVRKGAEIKEREFESVKEEKWASMVSCEKDEVIDMADDVHGRDLDWVSHQQFLEAMNKGWRAINSLIK